MESCFPPLAGLSLRGSSSSKKHKNRHSTGGSGNGGGGGGGGCVIGSSNTGCSITGNENNDDKIFQRHNNITTTTNNTTNNTTTSNGYINSSQQQIPSFQYQMPPRQNSEIMPKLEVLQDLDLYYIRQIASSLKELDLEQKIDLEIKMREGSAKLLAACNNSKNSSKSSMGFGGGGGGGGGGSGGGSGSNGSSTSPQTTQMLEAAKNLLTSNERMTAYMAELQRRKKDVVSVGVGTGGGIGGTTKRLIKPTGKVSISEIRMPLMWRDTDHFKNKGDHRRFAVFCLVKIDTEIYDTTLLCPVDRNSTDISFNDAILFTNISPDFQLKLEVYSVMMESDLSIASTPRKIKNTIHSSISRTVGKRLAANLKDELNNTKIGPKFELIASAQLSLDEASDLSHTHDLQIIPSSTNTPNNSTNNNNNHNHHHHHHTTMGSTNTFNSLPLFGHFCCRLAVQPDCIELNSCSGEITWSAKGPTRPLDGFGKLQAFRFDFWDDEQMCQQNIQPRRSIEINRDTKCKHRGELDIIINVMEEGTIEEYILRTKSLAETSKWYSAIKKSIKEHSLWNHVTLGEPMQLAIPANMKNYFLRPSASTRHRSLYDQVPILENHRLQINNGDGGGSNSRTTSQDIFAVPNSVDTSPTLNDFRSRTNSSSGRSSSHSSSIISAGSLGSITSSRKSHWPFGK